MSSIDIGRPICNTSVYVLDVRLNLQPIGVPGQLWIGGAELARGSFGTEALTKEKFIVNPFRKG
jgi:non-ribosomal peptide synthetase component F